MCKPGLCIRCRRGTHIIPALVGGSKVVAMHWGCGPRSLLRDWFREDLLRGQNLNMVLTIITISSSYTIFLPIRSQINNYKSSGEKRAADSIYELFKLGCFSINFHLSGYTFQQQPPYKISGVPVCIQWYTETISLLCDWSIGRLSLCPCQGILVRQTQCRGPTQLSKLVSIIWQFIISIRIE